MQLTKKDVVVIALGSLQGAIEAINTEDVAIAAHALAPTAFGWRKHIEQIDLDTVRTSLRHEKESPEARIDGSVRTGWNLTLRGQQWLTQHGQLSQNTTLTVAETPAGTAKRRLETRDASSAVDRVRTSTAYKSWAAGKPVTTRAAAEVFRIDQYTPSQERQLKTARIRELASGQDDLAQFLAIAIPAALELQAPTKPASREDIP